MLKTTFSIVVFVGAAFAVACTNADVDSEPNASEDDVTRSLACKDKACGDSCRLCAGRPGCFETAVSKFCNAEKRCESGPRPVCAAPSPGLGVGESCGGLTPDGPRECAEGLFCNFTLEDGCGF